jgi:hypothetical protein
LEVTLINSKLILSRDPLSASFDTNALRRRTSNAPRGGKSCSRGRSALDEAADKTD